MGTETIVKRIRWNYQSTLQITSSPNIGGTSANGSQPHTSKQAKNVRNNTRTVFHEIEKPVLETQTLRNERMNGRTHPNQMKDANDIWSGMTQVQTQVMNDATEVEESTLTTYDVRPKSKRLKWRQMMQPKSKGTVRWRMTGTLRPTSSKVIRSRRTKWYDRGQTE